MAFRENSSPAAVKGSRAQNPLRNLIKDVLETGRKQPVPELPRLKNNEERKEGWWNYKTWPLRHVDATTSLKYYEYRFDNGANG